MPASTSTTSEFSAAIDKIRQRIGTERARSTTPTRLRAARLAGRSVASSRRIVAKANSLHVANSFDKSGSRRIALRLCIDARHGGLERFAIEIGHDGYAGGFRAPARTLLEVFPSFAHEKIGLQRGVAKKLAVIGRQALPGLSRHHQHFRTHGVL